MRHLIIGSLVLAAVGILLISSVQSRIIRQHGIWHFQKRGFAKVYWDDRTTTEKWCFWVGVIFVFLPFIVAGVFSVIKQ